MSFFPKSKGKKVILIKTFLKIMSVVVCMFILSRVTFYILQSLSVDIWIARGITIAVIIVFAIGVNIVIYRHYHKT